MPCIVCKRGYVRQKELFTLKQYTRMEVTGTERAYTTYDLGALAMNDVGDLR